MTRLAPYYTVSYQTGNGIKSFRGPVMQRGYGLGGFFKGLARSFAPILKQSIAHVGKKALSTGVKVVRDVSQGRNLKEAIKHRGKESLNEVVADIKSGVKQKLISRKRSSKGKGTTVNKKKKRRTDIFD